MKPFSLLVKPAGSDCNLVCPYCFYRGKPQGRMTDALLKRMLESFNALPFLDRAVCFQGGEPLLMGEDFFRKAAEYAEGGIRFSLQTNATLVTESLAEFFAREDWLIGVSPHWHGYEAAQKGRAGYDRLVAAGCAVNVVRLVTKADVAEPEKLYHFLRDELGSFNQQYIECADPEPFALDGAEWGEFLRRLFDEWRRCGDERRVSVRNFDTIVSRLALGREDTCQFGDDCRHYLVVDWNGDVYPCDFHVEPEWRLGNLFEQSWEELIESPKEIAFGRRKRGSFDCPRVKGRFDAAYRSFFSYAEPQLADLLATL